MALDIETRPALAYVWGLWDQTISLQAVEDYGGVLCFGAKWLGEMKVEFWSDQNGHDRMVNKAWELLNEADAVLHYNGTSFDIRHLQREFMEAGLNPPSPFKQIDLLKVVRRQARFISNKLAHVAPQLGLHGKIDHGGYMDLWRGCRDGDPVAWRKMRRYNVRDVTELESLYTLLLPWIPNHPSHAAESGADVCPKCGSADLRCEGYATTQLGKFQKYQCKHCGGWSRSNKRESGAGLVQVTD